MKRLFRETNPHRRQLIQAEVISDEEYVERWLDVQYDGKELVCNNYEIKDDVLKVNLELSNKSKQTKTISLINNFEIININDNENIPKNISNDKVEIIEGNESIDIELEFDIKDMNININDYKIIFYSGVVTNNIAFVLKEE